MTYKKIALALSTPVDTDRIQNTANYYANGKFFIEIYRNGTCIFPPASMQNGAGIGVNLLTELGKNPIDFTVREMDDHNFIVRFTESIFSIVFGDEFIERRDEITQQAAGALDDEVLIGRPGAPQEHLLIGIYARTRLLEDIRTPMLVRSVEPSRTSK